MQPYTLNAGEGWIYRYGIDHIIKAGELQPGRGAALMELRTSKGEEPPLHTHRTEDELFYVVSGEVTFHCGDENFDVSDGGFMYLPLGIEHGYTIRSDGIVRLLAITFPVQESGSGWGGYIADVEKDGEVIMTPPDGAVEP